MIRKKVLSAVFAGAVFATSAYSAGNEIISSKIPKEILERKGITAIIGLEDGQANDMIELAKKNKGTIYHIQVSNDKIALNLQKLADSAGLLGSRIFVSAGSLERLHLADNLAKCAIVLNNATVTKNELQRIVQPNGYIQNKTVEKVKTPEGMDSWSHPNYNGSNNPVSNDSTVKAPYLTQYIAEPKWSPLEQITVADGGRLYRAMGGLATHQVQNKYLNNLFCTDAYSGIILWKRKLNEKFMIHRNSMIAIEDLLYLGHDKSCEVIDGKSGKTIREIKNSDKENQVWKWMSIEDGVLYALLGGKEKAFKKNESKAGGFGHWTWDAAKQVSYGTPEEDFGFGKSIIAFDAKTGKELWKFKSKEYIDARSLCMKNGVLYYLTEKHKLYSVKEGKELWVKEEPTLIEAFSNLVKPNHFTTGFNASTHMKCNDKYIVISRIIRKMFVFSTVDGKLLWMKEETVKGKYPFFYNRTVLFDDHFYARLKSDVIKFDFKTGKELSKHPFSRADCSKLTANQTSIFARTINGTAEFNLKDKSSTHMPAMRPPCIDGVITADGMLQWGPWMCGCPIFLYGSLGLSPHEHKFNVNNRDVVKEISNSSVKEIAPLKKKNISKKLVEKWKLDTSSKSSIAGSANFANYLFIANRNGKVIAVDTNTGKEIWNTYLNGVVFNNPQYHKNRLYIGTASGYVYALEAATGRKLWSFQAAPIERRIYVFGELISNWPIAGGLVIDDGILYTAAGIASHDTTQVYALNAETGKLIWHNNTSASLAFKTGGVSLQGDLYIDKATNKLNFAGGGQFVTAEFDLKTGKCSEEGKQFRKNLTAYAKRSPIIFHPYYPEFNQIDSIFAKMSDGNIISCDAKNTTGTKDFSQTTLALIIPSSKTHKKSPIKPGWRLKLRKKDKVNAVWEDKGYVYNAFNLLDDAIIVSGTKDNQASLRMLNLKDGKTQWQYKLSKKIIPKGIVKTDSGQIIALLADGNIQCFE